MLFSNWVSSVTAKMNVTSLISSSGTACQHHHHQINHAAYTISLLEAQHFLLSHQRNKIKIQVCSTRAQCKHVSSEENSNNSKISITVCYPCVCHKKRNSGNEGIHVPQIRKTGGGIQQILVGLDFWKELVKYCFFKPLRFSACYAVIKSLLPTIK